MPSPSLAEMKAMILAAGEGTRLRPLTANLPKPMLPLGGRPLLEHSVLWLARYGVRDLAVNLHHCPSAIRDYFGDGTPWGVHITYSFEPELLGTAGAVRRMAWFFSETFLVLYGDNLTNCDLQRLVTFHRERHSLVTMALHYRQDPSQSGMAALDEEDRVTRFVEKPRADQVFSNWVNAGLLVMEPQVLEYVPAQGVSDFGRDVFPHLIELGLPLYGYRLSEDESLWWIDTLEDLRQVEATWQEGVPL